MPVTGPQTENRTWASGIEPLWTSSDPHSAPRCAEKSTPVKGATAATPKHAAKTNVHKYHTKTQRLTSMEPPYQTECRNAWRPRKGGNCDKTEHGKA